jgi:hypothetical protein
MAGPIYGIQHCPCEWFYLSGKPYSDPFNDVELDVIFTDPQGQEHRMPAFWAGGQTWRIRYSPKTYGQYRYRTVATDTSNADLHGRQGVLEVSTYRGDNPLRTHGLVQVAMDRRHFEHADGIHFLWLGDTWWMGLCHRLRWPEDFQKLAANRVQRGFSVVQIVSGLYPHMPPFDPRGANEAGYPWEENYTRINPHYFDMADLRIQELVDRGLAPCIVGCWGYFLIFMGLPKIKQHWRNIVARWGAYPVFWCLAGEGTMPYYLSKNKGEDAAEQKSGWTEVARYVRNIDPYHHPITIHPSSAARDTVEDPAVLDFDMLQTGHGDRTSYPNTINTLTKELRRTPPMPVLVGEVCYEGILDENRQEVSRFIYWACMLSGAAGHTYGADGIWQVNTAEHPFGPSPHGRSWGRSAMEYRCRATRLAPSGSWQAFAGWLQLVATGAAPGMGGTSLERAELSASLCRWNPRGTPDHLRSSHVGVAKHYATRIRLTVSCLLFQSANSRAIAHRTRQREHGRRVESSPSSHI